MPLYGKTKRMSSAHYDKGLEMAKARNLTAAIESLKASLQINRKNIQARNLLGLCYYAVGRIGEALREWVISVNYGTDNNPAKGYLGLFQEDMGLLDKLSDATHNYNEALLFMQQYSEDLATIRLKRAVGINPNFVDAMNMLALVHMKTGEMHKAGALAEKVLAIDVGNPFARRYYREIFQKKIPSAKKLRAQADESSRSTINMPRENTGPQKVGNQNPFYAQTQRPAPKVSPISGILLFAAGLGAMFLFMYILVMPSFLEDSIAERNALATELNNRQAAHASQISERDEMIADLEEDLEIFQTLAAQQAEQNLNLQNESWVNTAYSYLSQELPREALNILLNVDAARLSPDARATYNHIRETAMPIMEAEYYLQGQSYFNAGNFAEAREALERAAGYITEGSDIADDILYFLGRVAEEEGYYNLAQTYFERVINDFPGSNRANAANAGLNRLEQD